MVFNKRLLMHNSYMVATGGILMALVATTVHYILLTTKFEQRMITRNKTPELLLVFALTTFVVSAGAMLFWLWGNGFARFK